MAETRSTWVGAPLRLRNGSKFVRGQAKYSADFDPSAIAHVAFVRSHVAHALLARVDVEAARGHPEAIAVLTAADFADQVSPFWGGVRGDDAYRTADAFVLARDKVRYVGEPVAMVVARSRYLAEDIGELVEIDFEALPAVVDAEAALSVESPRLYESWPDNELFHRSFSVGDVEGAFRNASLVVSQRFRSNRLAGVPLEARGGIADWNSGTSVLTLTAGVQDVHLTKWAVSQVLGLAPAQVRVVAPDTGGAFGVKLPIYPEELALCACARLLRRKVRWQQDRKEDLLCTTQARDEVVEAELALDSDGRIMAVRCRVVSDAGAYSVYVRGGTVEGSTVANDLCGPYKVPTFASDLHVAVTNKAPLGVYRAVGQPVTIFVMERLLDMASRKLGIDRLNLRRRNLVNTDEFPYLNVVGYDFEPGSYVESMDVAAERIGYKSFRAERQQALDRGRYIGIGFAVGNEPMARGSSYYGRRSVPVSGQEGCTIRIDPSGRVTAYLGTTDQGQGLSQAISQLIADQLTVSPDDVQVLMGDSELAPYGGGAWASRCALTAGGAALRATSLLRAKLIRLASAQLEAADQDLVLADGAVRVTGSPSSARTIEDLARIAYFSGSDVPTDIDPGLEVTSHYEPPAATFGNATHAAVVDVDVKTGLVRILRYVIVDDCGRVINPAIVHGQVIGGLAQGIGEAIYEQVVYNDDGQPLATTFMDYLVPSVHEMPDTVDVQMIETPSPRTALGIKGVGESGTCYSPGAIANAVTDALSPFGVEIVELPMTPSRIWDQLSRLRAKGAPAGRPVSES